MLGDMHFFLLKEQEQSDFRPKPHISISITNELFYCGIYDYGVWLSVCMHTKEEPWHHVYTPPSKFCHKIYILSEKNSF